MAAFVLMFPLIACVQGLSGLYETEPRPNGIIVPVEEAECKAQGYSWDKEAAYCREEYESTDRLGLIERAEGKLGFSFQLSFFNGHSCTMSGEAAPGEQAGQFVYRDPDYPDCVLSIVKTADSIELHDNGTCQTYCGARGVIEGAVFPLNSRAGDISEKELSCLAILDGSCAEE